MLSVSINNSTNRQLFSSINRSLATLLVFVLLIAWYSTTANSIDKTSNILKVVSTDSTLSRVSAEKSTLWTYLISKDNAKWTMMLSIQNDIESAKILYRNKSMEPTVQPFELQMPIGNESVVWKSNRGGTIIFRREQIVGIVSGALEWDLLVRKAEQLDQIFRTTSIEKLEASIRNIKEFNYTK